MLKTDTLTGSLKRLLVFIYAREKGIVGKQRTDVFIYSSLILIIGVIMNLCGIAGPDTPFFKAANSVHGFLTALILFLYYSRRVSLTTAISIFCIVSQMELSAETIYCALHNTPYHMALIIANMALSAIVLLLGIISYLRITPYAVATLSLLTYILSIYLTKNEIIGNFFMVFLLAFVILSLLGRKLTVNVTILERENSNLKDEQQEVLDIFHMSKEQMQSYMTLARNKRLDPELTAKLLQGVGGKAERQIRENVAYYMRQSAIEFERLRQRLPELSTSELEICSIILKEKKLKEISAMLGKSPSNITCQRTNIRTKLGLTKEDNLYQFLKKRTDKPE